MVKFSTSWRAREPATLLLLPLELHRDEPLYHRKPLYDDGALGLDTEICFIAKHKVSPHPIPNAVNLLARNSENSFFFPSYLQDE
jgi:hypothetical protein